MLQVADILKKLQSLGKSVYVITHDAALIMSCCTEMIRIELEANRLLMQTTSDMNY